MPAGKPFSQPFGEFHGRADMLSGSEVAHPPSPKLANTSRKKKTQLDLAKRNFTTQDKLR